MITIEAVEEWLNESKTINEICSKIDKDLAKELNKYNLLEELVNKRVTNGIKKKFLENITETQIATEWFGVEVDRHYLERRDDMESVSFRIVRNINKGVILEVHQRLQHREENWSEISERWGTEPEKLYGGKYNLTPLRQIAKEIKEQLVRLKTGEISEPIKIGKHYAILKLETWKNLELNNDMRRNLEEEMLANWKNKQAEIIIKHMLKKSN